MSGRGDQGLEELDAFIGVAAELADLSGPILTNRFRRDMTVEAKPDRTPVTQADRVAEAAMRELIEARYPDHGIVGEEFGAQRDDREFVWVIDPLDGTGAFLAGLPTFGTLVALCRNGVPIVGLIDHPALGERWVGAAGRATLFHGLGEDPRPARVRACASLEDAVLYTTSPLLFEGVAADAFAAVSHTTATQRFGTDCYGYAMVAAGHGDLVVEAGMNIHDYLSLVPVVTGAGGLITDWRGAALTMASAGQVAAAGDGRVHAQALEILGAGAG